MTRVDWAEVRRRVDAVGRALAGDGDDLPERAREVLKLVDALDESDDVQNVYTNADITPELAAALEEDED